MKDELDYAILPGRTVLRTQTDVWGVRDVWIDKQGQPQVTLVRESQGRPVRRTWTVNKLLRRLKNPRDELRFLEDETAEHYSE